MNIREIIPTLKAIKRANIEPKRNFNKFDKYVKIPLELDEFEYNTLNEIKDTIGNYAKHHDLHLRFVKTDDSTKMVVAAFKKPLTDDSLVVKSYTLEHLPDSIDKNACVEWIRDVYKNLAAYTK